MSWDENDELWANEPPKGVDVMAILENLRKRKEHTMTETQMLKIEVDKLKDEVKHREKVISEMVSNGYLREGEVRAKWVNVAGSETLVQV